MRKTEAVRHAFESLSLVVGIDQTEEQFLKLETSLRRGEIVGHAVNLARDLVNTPPAEKSPRHLADRVALVAADAGLAVDIWDERGSATSDSAACSASPRARTSLRAFVVLDYRQGGDAPTLALVGKGVTFDSGGLSLKPSASMEDMKSDMTGAAVVVATMQAAARLAIPVNVTGYLALTENMTGGKAMKLGDVLTMRNGKTVEVMNTDAEGRLILADALSYAVEHKPHRVLDLATLTGACMVALGPKVAGLFSNDDAFRQDLMAACRQTGERAWGLPLDDDYKEQLKSHVADLKNVGGKWGGAITAAKFLEQFVGSTPWVHLDIAGPSWSDSENATRDTGGTGCFVRTLVAYLERQRADLLDHGRRPGERRRIKPAFDPAAIDVESQQNLQHVVHRQAVLEGPEDDIQVLAAVLEVFHDGIDQGRSLEGRSAAARNRLDRARSRTSCPGDVRASDVSETHSSARRSSGEWPSHPGRGRPSHSRSTCNAALPLLHIGGDSSGNRGQVARSLSMNYTPASRPPS